MEEESSDCSRAAEESQSRRRTVINLYCPSLAKLSTIVVPPPDDHNRIDIGAIAKTFGLDPATVKLNGHFISRGVDLVASSVTWKSLISFFSARRLPTGIITGFCCNPSSVSRLIVDGKQLLTEKSRPKRSHDVAETGIIGNLYRHHHQVEDDDGVDSFKSGNCIIMSGKKQRVLESASGCERVGRETMTQEEDGTAGFKRRRQQAESRSSSSPLKRLKEKGGFSKMLSSWSKNSAAAAELPLGAKRAREEDDDSTTPLASGSSCKRVLRPWEEVSCPRIDGGIH